MGCFGVSLGCVAGGRHGQGLILLDTLLYSGVHFCTPEYIFLVLRSTFLYSGGHFYPEYIFVLRSTFRRGDAVKWKILAFSVILTIRKDKKMKKLIQKVKKKQKGKNGS